jgi:hypothetical protein
MNLTTGIVACPSATGHGAAAPTGLETAGVNSYSDQSITGGA